MTIRYADTWRDVSRRIGFFTKETRGLIPETSGCYAWFVPLWIFGDDLQSFLETVSELLLYDPENEGVAERSVRAQYNWDALDITLRKRSRVAPSVGKLADWQAAMANSELKTGLQQGLMEASIFMPPLYVGKADNLRARYLQHVEGKGDPRDNTFHNRFCSYAKRAGLPLEVSDLIFVCIQTPPELVATYRDRNLHELLEHILMRLCRPAFSIR